MKNILVATDFSNNAYCALFYATQLLKSQPCTFYLLNTYNELSLLEGENLPGFRGKKVMNQLKAASEEGLARTSYRIVLDNGNPNHQFKTISKKGDLIKRVLKIIDNKEIDLVVMGNKGQNQTRELFFGSNTIKVVNEMTNCPVLAIPGEMDYITPKDIAFVTDYRTGCQAETIAPLLFLATLLDASIKVIHINESKVLSNTQEINRGLLGTCLEGITHSYHEIYEFSDKAKTIDSTLDKFKIDLFSMVHNRRSLFQRLTREPVIKDLSMYSDVPFLVLPNKESN
ncbi:universal stress protein [Arenibacter latericius]|uniref:universal stress protein n=1 Tax=Arenibacter latericius TaxID=86104 RepID=UPI00047D60B1|nr:universal stress protein [Arenibacter latericius]